MSICSFAPQRVGYPARNTDYGRTSVLEEFTILTIRIKPKEPARDVDR